MAVKACVKPFAIDGAAGVTPIDTRAAGPTVSVELPVTPLKVALIWAAPCAAPFARPSALMAALAVDDVQLTEPVTSMVEPSV